MSQGPRHFTEKLEALKGRLLIMGGLAEERLRLAMRALVDRDHDRLADVISGDARIDELQMEIDDRCFTLLALYQPVAVDLRTIVSTLKISADLERVGDLAVNIGEDVIFIVEARDVRHRTAGPVAAGQGGGAGTIVERRKKPRIPPV